MTKGMQQQLNAMLRASFGQLRSDRRGNIMITMAFAAIPLVFAIGFAIDYARAEKLHTKLNAAADAAALAGVDPAMILQPDSTASNAAKAMFTYQTSQLSGLSNVTMTTTVTDGASSSSSGALGYLRKVTVSYTAKSTNLFGGILGVPTLSFTGTSTASAQQPPNVNFYVVMDNSPSMLLPSTSDGLTRITNGTTTSHLSDGCDFACHEQLPHSDNIYINDSNSRQVLLSTSYYTSGSANQNVYYLWDPSTSRLYDSSGNAMNTSSSSSSSSTTTSGYGSSKKTIVTTVTTVTAVSYSITDSTSGPVTITKATASTPTTVTATTQYGNTTTTTSTGSTSNSSSTYDTGYWADGYWLTHNYGLINSGGSSITMRRDDAISAISQLVPFASNQSSQYNVTYQMQLFSFNWTHPSASTPVTTLNSMTNVNSYGSGFSAASLFPADDYWWTNSQPTSSTNINDQGTEFSNMLSKLNGIMATPGNGSASSTPQEIMFIITDGMSDELSSGSRWHGPLNSNDLAQCTTIKSRGIKIAVLYTQYLSQALYGDSWSQTNIAPYLPPPPVPYPAGNAGSSDQVLTALQSCASPGSNGLPLVQTVTTDGDFTAALQQLFSTALQSARLVQ